MNQNANDPPDDSRERHIGEILNAFLDRQMAGQLASEECIEK